MDGEHIDSEDVRMGVDATYLCYAMLSGGSRSVICCDFASSSRYVRLDSPVSIACKLFSHAPSAHLVEMSGTV